MNTQIRMKRHPKGMVTPEDFEITKADLPELKDGEALVRNQYLSLDPYMRPRMDPIRSYAEPLKPGELMPGGTPTLLYKQYREMRFTMAPATLTEAMKLNGSDYRAEVAFKSAPVRYFRTEATYDAPQGWSNWKDDFLENLAVERRNGKWIISDANYFEGILPTGPIPGSSGQ